MIKKMIKIIVLLGIFAGLGFWGYRVYYRIVLEKEILKKVISRLEAESRVADVLVTSVKKDPVTKKILTTIKFLEYDVAGKALSPRYFTFTGNIIQFQSLVIRFQDELVRAGDALKGKSVFIFWKVFMLDGKNTQEFNLTEINQVPVGYKIDGVSHIFEEELWEEFWKYALNSEQANKKGIKNAQIEAPGMMFVPGNLYTIIIEHDGGLRIDAHPLPEILRGEMIL